MYTIVHRLSSLVETGARASPASEHQLPPSQPTRPNPPIAPVCHGSTHTALHPSEVNSHDFPFVCHLSRGLRTPLPHMPTRPRARDAIVGASLGCPLQEGEQESEAYINSGCNALPAAHPPSPVRLALHMVAVPVTTDTAGVPQFLLLRPWYPAPPHFLLISKQLRGRKEICTYSCGHGCCHSLQGCIAPVPMTRPSRWPVPSELYLIRRLVRCLCPCRSKDIYEKCVCVGAVRTRTRYF